MRKILFLIIVLVVQMAQAQNVGIGTTNPLARLHVIDSSVLFSAPGGIPVTPGNISISGSGRRMMWYPDKAAFRAGYVTGTQWNQGNIGDYSFAAGYDAIASGNYSTSFHSIATGEWSVAIGGGQADGITSVALGGSWAATDYSTAIGNQNYAAGFASTALGSSSVASGEYSIAMGYNATSLGSYSHASGIYTNSMGQGSYTAGAYTISKSVYCFTIGHNNDTSDHPNPMTWNQSDRIFQVGNGLNNPGRKNAMTVLRNGNTGLGPVVPLARLHVTDSSVLFSATGNVPSSPGNMPVSDAGRRMLWYADKAAFRAGYVNANHWDKDSTGIYSIAMGYNTKAIGEGSVALGYGTRASENGSTAMGAGSQAMGAFSTAMGANTIAYGNISTAFGAITTATGGASTAMGDSTIASGDNSTAMGYATLASGLSSTAMGERTIASGYYSTAMGIQTTASSHNSVAMGGATTASGYSSAAMGLFTTAKANASLSIGAFNDNSDNPDEFTPASNDRLFQIGNGTDITTRSNAITVLRNGNTGIGMINPAFLFEVNNRMRIRSGGDLSNSAGVWLNKTDNSTLQAFMGITNDNAVGFYGQSGAGWGLTMNTATADVGIANTSPNAPLAFANAVGKKISLYESSPNSQYGFAVQGAQLQVYSDNPAAKITFGYFASGVYTERMYLTNSTGILTVNGTNYPSDVRLKKDIRPLQNSLQKIMQLGGYNYYWKNENADNRLQTGVLAQEVQKLFPELVTENKDGMLSVNYSGLIPVMIESIKEQQQQIDELKKLVKQLLEKKN